MCVIRPRTTAVASQRCRLHTLVIVGSTPDATAAQRGWGEVLAAATLQGAIFALVKAATDRGAATVTRKLTGFWPGKGAEAEK